MLARAPKKKGKSSKAAVDEGPTGTVSPIQDKLNGMYMKALEAKKRPRPDMTEGDKAEASVLAKEYTRRLWAREEHLHADAKAKSELRMRAIVALPEELQMLALSAPDDPMVPADYRVVLHRPPQEGWHRPRVSLAAQELAGADEFFKKQAALGSSMSSAASKEEVEAALGQAETLDEDEEKARRQKKAG